MWQLQVHQTQEDQAQEKEGGMAVICRHSSSDIVRPEETSQSEGKWVETTVAILLPWIPMQRQPSPK